MKKFLVLYMAPAAGVEAWMKIPEAERKVEEEKMQKAWGEWSQGHTAMLRETAGAGKNKRVTKEGVKDTANDVMLYSMVEAETQEEVAKAYEGHPHLDIPGSWIEIMPANVLPGMS